MVRRFRLRISRTETFMGVLMMFNAGMSRTGMMSALFAAVAVGALVVGGMGAAIAAGQGQGAGGAKAQGQGQGAGGAAAHGSQKAGGKGGKSLTDIFRDVAGEAEDGEDSDAPDWAGAPGGGKSGMGGGKPATAGAKKGDLFGDVVVILRDSNGVPILSDAGFVQPIDVDGNLIPLNEDGEVIDATLVVPVELGRLNVGRSPTKVLDRRAEEVVKLLEDAIAISLDPAGRLTITTLVDGEEVAKTIDSPLENLALYSALLTQGTIPGISDLPGEDFDFLVDGVYDVRDLSMTAALLAGATDKTSPLTKDEIAIINAFLGINTTQTGDVIYSVIDYSEFTYDRSDTFEDREATVLIQQPDGSWVTETVNIYEEVFGSVDFTASGTIDAYTQAADDARAALLYVHEYSAPEDQITATSN